MTEKPSSRVTFVDSNVVAVHEDVAGSVDDARFIVTADVQGNGREEYLLEAMTSKAYNAWYMEHRVEGQLAVDEVFPLVIPLEQLGSEGLVAHVQSRYLSRETPDRLNDIRGFLVRVAGPGMPELTTGD